MKTKDSKAVEVWLIEDNTTFSSAVQRVVDGLEGMYCSENFRTVEEAFNAMEQGGCPDVILLDVQLPGMDGISALSKLKMLAPKAQIIILTVFDDADKIFRAVCAGASGYILKSSGSGQIGGAIRQALEGGAPMTPEVARKVLDAFARLDSKSGDGGEYNLTSRECDILRLMADGLYKKEIADSLGISIHTVSTHIQRVYEKLHVSTNTGAVAKALRERLI